MAGEGTNHRECTTLLPLRVFQWECLSEVPEPIIILKPLFGPLGQVQPLQVRHGGHYMSRRSPAQEKLGTNLLSEIEHPMHCLIPVLRKYTFIQHSNTRLLYVTPVSKFNNSTYNKQFNGWRNCIMRRILTSIVHQRAGIAQSV